MQITCFNVYLASVLVLSSTHQHLLLPVCLVLLAVDIQGCWGGASLLLREHALSPPPPASTESNSIDCLSISLFSCDCKCCSVDKGVEGSRNAPKDFCLLYMHRTQSLCTHTNADAHAHNHTCLHPTLIPCWFHRPLVPNTLVARQPHPLRGLRVHGFFFLQINIHQTRLPQFIHEGCSRVDKIPRTRSFQYGLSWFLCVC